MIIVALALAGLVFGSFVNALVWRLYEQARLRRKGTGAADPALSMVKGRSMCSHCHHQLAAADLVPLLSWLALRGKCRYCGAPIADSPLVELATASLFVGSYVWWPYPIEQGWWAALFGSWLVLAVLYVALAVYDIRWFVLPDRLTYALAGGSLAYAGLLALSTQNWRLLADSALGVGVIFGLFFGLFWYSRGQWIGGGDVKLALALGVIAGTALHAVMVVFVASLLGTIASLPLVLKGRRGMKQHIPFGPYLLAGSILVLLFGDQAVQWYQNLLLR